MRWLVLAMGLPLAACLQIGTDTGTGTGTGTGTTSSSSGSSGGSSGSSGGAGATQGSGCTTDMQTGITLCEQIANCPGVDVDQGAFPSCGFRMSAGSTYDLECWCGQELCPVGVPISCATASQLLDQEQSSIVVCQQADTGSCLIPGASGSSSGGSSTCDKSCEAQCAGEPGCIQLCGC